MALKDLKSDLSKFRRPIEKPLTDKKRVEVPKSTNQTPLSQFVDKTPNTPKSNTPTPKKGVSPNNFDNSSKFLGETTPTDFDNSSNYLGETTPSKMSLEERFLGQTETQEIQQGDKFKGETQTTTITQGDRFKGETTPQDYSNVEKFKGETTPSEFRFTQQFLGETEVKELSFTQQFLGETTPNEFNNESKFLGETTPNEFNNESKFLGETDRDRITQGDKVKGETTPQTFNFNPKFDDQAKDPKFVDFITNDDARGFSPFQKPKNNSTFVGVDPSQTQFEGLTPISGQFVLNQYGVNKENDNGLGTSYTDKVLKETYNKFNLRKDSYNSSIIKQPFILSGIQRKKGEPQTLGFGSFSFIRGGAITSTTRAAIDVARFTQFLLTPRGITWTAKQVGMQRSQKYGKKFTPVNLLASLAGQHLGLRFDRPGKQPLGDETWKYNNNGYLTGIYNVFKLRTKKNEGPIRVDSRGGFDSIYGIGVSNTSRKINTFTNPGMKFGDYKARFIQTYGVFGSDANVKTGEPLNTYSDDTPLNDNESKKFGVAGEIDSVYKELNDLDNNQKKSNTKAEFEQKINPTEDGFSPKEDGYEKTTKKDSDNNVIGDLVSQTQTASQIPIDEIFENRGLYKSDGLLPNQPDIADYEAISYGTIAKIANGDKSSKGDFRNLKKTKFNRTSTDTGGTDYTEYNREKTYGTPATFKTNSDRIAPGNSKQRIDNVYDSIFNAKLQNDFVHLFFAYDKSNGTQDNDKIIQFRSTINGVTETFSPSWNGIKYPGRADKAYMYTEFERTLSFSFKAYASSRDEMKVMWQKLSELSKLTMPTYGSAYSGHICYFRLGQIWGNGYKGVPSLITSLTYTIPDDLPWEINHDGNLAELPMGVDVNIGLTILPDTIYKSNKNHYSFYETKAFK